MLVLMAITVVLPATAQAAWSDSATMTFEPAELFAGETYTASYTLDISNSVDVTQLTITQVVLKYEWESSLSIIFSGTESVDSFPYQHIFTHDVQVPADLEAGDYGVDVSVTAFVNGTLESVSGSFSDTVTVSGNEVSAVATADPTSGLAPQEVSFDVTASGGSGGYSYSWDFGDGSAAGSGRSPTHTYTAGGTYVATVTVTDSLGRSAQAETDPITIAPGMSVSITAQPSSGPYPLEVKFNNTVTNAASGDLTYLWDFGDGATSSETAPTHTYEEAGNYNVNLTVTDSQDRSGVSNVLTIHVSASVNPVATISASVESGSSPLTVGFTSDVTGGTYPYTYEWNFGDGTTSTEANPSHTFEEPGVYIVRLTATDSASRQDVSEELAITVTSDTTMNVTIAASNITGTMPLTVSFNSTILNGTGPYFYRWSFGDGVNSTTANPTHVYQKVGTYNVTLTVTDSNSNVSISNKLIIVVSEPPATTVPTWVWIWGSTAIIIVAVGVISFLMMRRQM